MSVEEPSPAQPGETPDHREDPKAPKDNGHSFNDILWGAVTDLRIFFGTLRLLGTLVLMLLLLVGAIWWLVRWLQPPITVRVNYSGAVEISTTRSNKTAVFLLSSNGGEDSPWIDTGIALTPGNKVTITASGKICMAIHRMIEANQADALPPVPWTGPEGLNNKASFPARNYRPQEADRAKYRLASDLPPGRLIAIVSSDKPSSDSSVTTKLNDGKPSDEGKPLDIGKKQSFTSNSNGNLWLTVNDIWLGPNEADVYKPHTASEYLAKIETPRYWNIWYDDNAGSFLVTIEISP